MPGVPGAVEVYLRTRKIPDLPWNLYVARPVAAPLVAALSGTRVTPNQITLVSLAVALCAVGLLLAAPGYVGLVTAAVVFELSYVLDCADGMLARLRGTASTAGHLLDFLMDEIKAFAVLGAVAVRLHFETGAALPLLVGVAGLVVLASGIAMTSFVRHPEVAGPGVGAGTAPDAGPSPSLVRRAVSIIEAVAKQIIHYPSYLLVVALTGRAELYLYPYVLVNALYSARALLGIALRFGSSRAL